MSRHVPVYLPHLARRVAIRKVQRPMYDAAV
jgi:hypothetical protein